MINFQVLLIVLAALMSALLGVLIKQLTKVKVWIYSRAKENQPLVRTCYLEKGEEGVAAEVHRMNAQGKPALALIKVDEKSTRNRGYVEMLMTDMNDDAEKPHYRRTGYISFDEDTSVDQYGYIYKQVKGKKEKELIGYLARPSRPDVPTIYGERSWKTLWLRCTLCAYAGQPMVPPSATTPAEAPQQVKTLCLNAKKKLDEPALPEEDIVPSIPLDEDIVPELPAEEDIVPQIVDEVPVITEEPTEEPVEPKPTEEPVEPKPTEEPVEPKPTEEPVEPKPTEEPKPLEKPLPKVPMAECYYVGFHNSKKDLLPPEARAATFAMLQRFAPKQRQPEYAAEQPYGWKDTALLSALIYTVLFILLYLVNSGIFQMPLLGKDWESAAVFVGYYFVLWAIVRFIKIDAIENANSFQPILDLFNKNLGLKWTNIAIVALSLIAAIFTIVYYDYDFLPLLLVIAIGVTINMTLPAANRRWKVQASFLEENAETDEEEEETDSEPQNPQGDISRSYEWDLDDTYDAQRQVHGSLTLYFKAADIRDIRHLNPFFSQRKDHSDKENILYMFRFLKKYKKTFLARTHYIAYTINKIAEKNNFSPTDKMQFTLDFVQEPNIAFQENSENKTINFYDDYIRFPDETLYDKCGDSNSKSLLAAMLFHLMGNNVLYLISRKHQHSAIGVEVRKRELMDGWYGDASRIDEIAVKYEDRYYIFCETTGDKFSLGKQVSGMSLDEFDEKIYLPLREDEDDAEQDSDREDVIESRIFNWELDSLLGHKLSGSLPIEMSTIAIDNLRAINPFNTYGQDSNTYQQNVISIFRYMQDNPSSMSGLRQVADYIRTAVRDAGYPELDLLQFALDFAQAPNITYVVDEKSIPIDGIKEYMRFPEEVLFDKEGDCDCKSSLAAGLFLSLGYKTVFLISQKLSHAAVAVECKDPEWLSHLLSKPEDVVLEHNGVTYLYCETTGDGYHIGQIKENESIHDFETVFELPL